MQDENPVLEFVEANGNRVTFEEAMEHFAGSVREGRREEYINAWIDETKSLATDRYGGKDRIEKVVY